MRFGRVQDEYIPFCRDTSFESRAYGKRTSKEYHIPGRVILDPLQQIQRNYKLRSYSLNAVSDIFLGEKKEDVHHSIITTLWKGSSKDRQRLAFYCLKDAYLPQRLIDTLLLFTNSVEMVRVCGIPMKMLFSKGQQAKVQAQLISACRKRDFLVPTIYESRHEEKYEGAIVIEPLKGFYTDPIATLDFSSLYPSIMTAHNICYSTLLTKEQADQMDEKDYTKTPNLVNNTEAEPQYAYFVKSHIRRGILPMVLENLLKKRAQAKEDLKHAETEQLKMVLDGRQLALKISANSVYGYTTAFQLPLLVLGRSVTAFGRDMIIDTKQVCESTNWMDLLDTPIDENTTNVPGLVQVIYGDTDSVMIRFGCESIAVTIELAHKVARIMNSRFTPPIKLLFEKVFYPYLLISKKRYIGLLWEEATHWKQICPKGVESVRRDNCLLTSETVKQVSDILLIERDVEKAIQHVRDTVNQLLDNKIDLSKLVISKNFSKNADEYKSKQTHIELIKKIQKRTPDQVPQIGDRVPYVVISIPGKKRKTFEKVEDPIYALEHNLPIDAQYYITNQLKKPLLRIFGPICGLAEAERRLFHNYRIRNHSSTIGIGKFLKKIRQCQHCGMKIDTGVCCSNEYCQSKRNEYQEKAKQEAEEAAKQWQDTWNICLNCQGTEEKAKACSARDCPIFFQRAFMKNQKEKTEQNWKLFFDW